MCMGVGNRFSDHTWLYGQPSCRWDVNNDAVLVFVRDLMMLYLIIETWLMITVQNGKRELLNSQRHHPTNKICPLVFKFKFHTLVDQALGTSFHEVVQMKWMTNETRLIDVRKVLLSVASSNSNLGISKLITKNNNKVCHLKVMCLHKVWLCGVHKRTCVNLPFASFKCQVPETYITLYMLHKAALNMDTFQIRKKIIYSLKGFTQSEVKIMNKEKALCI